MTTRRDRARLLARKHGITRKRFVDETGFSDDQFQYWFGDAKRTGSPSSEQISRICDVFDWSPTFIFFGLGPETLTELRDSQRAIDIALQNQVLLLDILSHIK